MSDKQKKKSLNLIGFEPCGHYLIVRLDKVEKEKKSDGGILLTSTSKDHNVEQKGTSLAKVVAIGKNAWTGHTDPYGEFEPWCEVGDMVMIAQYAGQPFPVPLEASEEERKELALHVIIKDDDIIARSK